MIKNHTGSIFYARKTKKMLNKLKRYYIIELSVSKNSKKIKMNIRKGCKKWKKVSAKVTNKLE